MPVPQNLTLDRHDCFSQATLTLAGELDMDTAPALRMSVAACLHDGIRTIDLDLTALTFCDVSGLNAFLAAADRITSAGGSLCLHHPCRLLGRLLDLSGTGFLLRDRSPESFAAFTGLLAS